MCKETTFNRDVLYAYRPSHVFVTSKQPNTNGLNPLGKGRPYHVTFECDAKECSHLDTYENCSSHVRLRCDVAISMSAAKKNLEKFILAKKLDDIARRFLDSECCETFCLSVYMYIQTMRCEELLWCL